MNSDLISLNKYKERKKKLLIRKDIIEILKCIDSFLTNMEKYSKYKLVSLFLIDLKKFKKNIEDSFLEIKKILENEENTKR